MKYILHIFFYLLLLPSISSFTGGSGTSSDPYNITSCNQLQNMSSNLTAHYQLSSNIDCDISPYNTGAGFVPIGFCNDFSPCPSDDAFMGSLEGNNFTIYGLYINNNSKSSVGLFGATYYANISNIRLENINILANYSVGGIVGYNHYGYIENIFTQGSLSGGNHVGGLIGTTFYSSIDNSISNSIISAENYIGGLVGSHGSRHGFIGGTINNSYSRGSVSGNFSVGGLIGYNVGFSTVLNSYSTSDVVGINNTGGLVGINDYSGEIRNSFSTGDVSGGVSGSFIGENRNFSTVVNSYVFNSSQNPILTIGYDMNGSTLVNAQTDISYFYNDTNQPFNGIWNPSIWSFSGNSLPELVSNRINSNSATSAASLFPHTSIFLPLLLIVWYFI